MTDDFTYCADYVRDHDKDRYLLSLFAKGEQRDALQTLFAFYTEIAKTRESVSETAIGLMRLLWWREGVQAIYQDDAVLRDHPVLRALSKVVKDYDLPLKLFEDLTYGREFDLEGVPPGNMEGLKNYCRFTHAPLLELCALIMGEKKPTEGLAISYAMIGLLRSFIVHAQQQRHFLPHDLLNKHNMSEEDVLFFRNTEALNDIRRKIGEVASDILEHTPHFEMPFFRAYRGLAKVYLSQLKAHGYDVREPRLALPPIFKELRVWKAATF